MSHERAENSSSISIRPEGQLQADSKQGQVSRRGVLAGLARAPTPPANLGNAQVAGGPCDIDPEFMDAVEEDQLNGTNQALVISPDRGAVVTFGNSVYQFDSVANTFTLCRNGRLVLRGRATIRTEDSRDVIIEEVESLGAT